MPSAHPLTSKWKASRVSSAAPHAEGAAKAQKGPEETRSTVIRVGLAQAAASNLQAPGRWDKCRTGSENCLVLGVHRLQHDSNPRFGQALTSSTKPPPPPGTRL